MNLRLWLDERIGTCVGCRFARDLRRYPTGRTDQDSAARMLRRFGTTEAALAYMEGLPNLDGVRRYLHEEDADWWARQEATLRREGARDPGTAVP